MSTEAWLREVPIAHRGLHGAGVPENTMAAFDAAARAGYGVELDIRVTRDRRLVVVHDRDTARVTGTSRDVTTSTADELAPLRIAGSHPIPLLDDVLAAHPTTPLLIEIKPGPAPALATGLVVDALGPRRRDIALQSFDPRIVLHLARHHPAVTRGQLSGPDSEPDAPRWRRLVLRAMVLDAVARPHFLAHDVEDLADPFLRSWRRALGVPLLAWTVRSPAQLARARDVGANVIFEGVDPHRTVGRTGGSQREPVEGE